MTEKDTTGIEYNAIETWVASDGDGALGIIVGLSLTLPFGWGSWRGSC